MALIGPVSFKTTVSHPHCPESSISSILFTAIVTVKFRQLSSATALTMSLAYLLPASACHPAIRAASNISCNHTVKFKNQRRVGRGKPGKLTGEIRQCYLKKGIKVNITSDDMWIPCAVMRKHFISVVFTYLKSLTPVYSWENIRQIQIPGHCTNWSLPLRTVKVMKNKLTEKTKETWQNKDIDGKTGEIRIKLKLVLVS